MAPGELRTMRNEGRRAEKARGVRESMIEGYEGRCLGKSVNSVEWEAAHRKMKKSNGVWREKSGLSQQLSVSAFR